MSSKVSFKEMRFTEMGFKVVQIADTALNYQPEDWLYILANDIIQKYNYDSSHDLVHFNNVVNYGKEILISIFLGTTDISFPLYNKINRVCKSEIPNLIEGLDNVISVRIILDACFCHDLIDSKYVDSNIMIEEIKKVFLSNGYRIEEWDILCYLIQNISFSKQRQPNWKPNSVYELALNIVSDADKLDAYRIERIIAYQDTKYEHLPEEERNEKTKKWLKTILVKRVLEYKNKWLKTKYAKCRSVDMHNRVEQYVKDNLENVEMEEY